RRGDSRLPQAERPGVAVRGEGRQVTGGRGRLPPCGRRRRRPPCPARHPRWGPSKRIENTSGSKQLPTPFPFLPFLSLFPAVFEDVLVVQPCIHVAGLVAHVPSLPPDQLSRVGRQLLCRRPARRCETRRARALTAGRGAPARPGPARTAWA